MTKSLATLSVVSNQKTKAYKQNMEMNKGKTIWMKKIQRMIFIAAKKVSNKNTKKFLTLKVKLRMT